MGDMGQRASVVGDVVVQAVDDGRSELGGLYDQAVFEAPSREPTGPFMSSGFPGDASRVGLEGRAGGRGFSGMPMEGVVRSVAAGPRTVGRGVIPVDPRKFRYDKVRARTLPMVEFGATKADRMDAEEAGDLLHRIHEVFRIQHEGEDILQAFDNALFFEHTINGASMLQPGRGKLYVGDSEFELATVKRLLAGNQRRFFRAFADEIADVNLAVLRAYDPYDVKAAEKHGQLMQVAIARGLHKYPHLAHDSSDAGLRISLEERFALATSKRLVLPSVINSVDKTADRVPVGEEN